MPLVLDRDLDRFVRVEVLEALSELIGVVEDVLDRSRHESHRSVMGLEPLDGVEAGASLDHLASARSSTPVHHSPGMPGRG